MCVCAGVKCVDVIRFMSEVKLNALNILAMMYRPKAHWSKNQDHLCVCYGFFVIYSCIATHAYVSAACPQHFKHIYIYLQFFNVIAEGRIHTLLYVYIKCILVLSLIFFLLPASPRLFSSISFFGNCIIFFYFLMFSCQRLFRRENNLYVK